MTDAKPLTGFTIGVTAYRRATEFSTLLTRLGGTVVQAPAIRILPLHDDTELRRSTRQIIDDPPEFVLITTGIGFRGWMEAAAGLGQADEFRHALASTRLLARGRKAKGAIRAADLREQWSPVSGTAIEMLDHLVAEGVVGKRIAVQLHGAGRFGAAPDLCDRLGRAGADVIPVPVYRTTTPEECGPLDRMLDQIACSAIDAVTFTSTAAAMAILARAKERGITAPIVDALRNRVLVACMGPVTSAPFHPLDIPTTTPARPQLGELAWRLADELPRRAQSIRLDGHEVSIRSGSHVVVDGEARQLPPSAMALMRVLGTRPGRVIPRDVLLAALPGGGSDPHAVEVAIGRLRAALGVPTAVQTVVKRGYRLALD
ncbi:uroporphyrinogen-III synthase [Nocardia sp. NPDC059239]|uniref:uroporphyrinogen-III synthase n=1 Tax=unclassified Nocardia TaxID=2637762 RepID=UPI00369148B0